VKVRVGDWIRVPTGREAFKLPEQSDDGEGGVWECRVPVTFSMVRGHRQGTDAWVVIVTDGRRYTSKVRKVSEHVARNECCDGFSNVCE
jgi:hypothetical protein